MSSSNGDRTVGPLDVGETLQLQLEDGSTHEFEVRAILEDAETHESFAVLERETDGDAEDEVIVTDLEGNLVEDEDQVQDVLDNYFIFAEEAGDPEGAG